ncbi:MAG: hypothetical protein ACOYN6_15115 [Ignavibacteria bacterium]
MKTLKLFVLLSALISISYLLSCDMNKNSGLDNSVGNKVKSETDTQGECNANPDRCPIPSYCNNGKGVHFCLYLRYGDSQEEFDYANIVTARVTHTGTDCNGNTYYCNYIVSGTNATTMGTVLPWCSNYCQYTRTVCLVTSDNKTYTGSITFSYINYSGCTVDLYLSEENCDFGGIERNEN